MAGFNIEQFKNTKFTDRTAEVALPVLAQFFADDVKPVFTVRGLTAAELGRANEEAANNRNMAALAEGLIAADDQGKIEAMRELVGLSDNVPDDIVKRHSLLAMGSVDPQLDHGAAVLIAERCPVEFYQLTTKILQLTGEGRVPGKLNACGATVSAQ